MVTRLDVTLGSESSSSSEALVETLLFELIELPADQRPDALQAMGRQHPELVEVLQRRLGLLESQLPVALAQETFGRFELVRRLGVGMAEVYLAIDSRDGAQVVVKILRHPDLLDAQTSGSFAREARAASALQHPCIGAVLEIGAIGPTPYLVLPYVPGITLADWIRQKRARGRSLGPADLDLVLGWLEQILRALHAAHAAGLVHRDVKPSNILLPFQGPPRLLDFGLCRELGSGTVAGTPTPAAGTLAYMAPELLSLPGRSFGPAADVYALGVTLFECITLHLPFEGDNRVALCRAILLQDPPDPHHVARGLRRVLACALAKTAAERYPTAAAFADDLLRLRRGDCVAPVRGRPWPRLRRWWGRCGWIEVSALLSVVLLLVALIAGPILVEEVSADFELLAIPEQVRAAEARAETLVPGWPEQVPAFLDWLRRDGEVLCALLPPLRARVASLDREAGTDPEVAETLRAALVQLEAFAGERGTLAVVRARLEWARNVGKITTEMPAVAWQETIAAIAAEPRYGGLRIGPQLDLVPLGRDPRSGLFEFYHPRSGLPGTPAVQRGERGQLEVHEFSGLVFVLIPGGRCLIGEQPFDPDLPRYDPHAAVYARPYEFTLGAFFVSKYELTQGQWQQLTGDRPSFFRVGQRHHGDPPITYRHPVESVSALQCDEVLRAVGLLLPTEAQWEYACGVGAATRWFFGNDVSQLPAYANIDDRRFLASRPGVQGTLDVDDGFANTAPVGWFLPNPFGLFDMMGNVAEWCRDDCADYAISVPAPGDGMRVPPRLRDPHRSFRGSHYAQRLLKTSSRPGWTPDGHDATLGLRPVRRLQEDPR